MMADLEEGLQHLGLRLDSNAMGAMRTLPLDHALELAKNVKDKVASGHIRNASSYVCATVVRGYVPEANGGAQAFCQAQSTEPTHQVPAAALQVVPNPPNVAGAGDMTLAVARLTSTIGMVKAAAAGVSLSDEAVQALLKLPTQHASSLLEQVAEKKDVIRDLSNYVIATVARGYHPKEGGLVGGHLGVHQSRPKAMPEQPLAPIAQVLPSLPLQPQFSLQRGANAPPERSKGKGKTKEKESLELVPSDASTVEMAILDLNQKDLWDGQRLDAESLLALRCIPEEQGMDLLGSLYSKGTGKGNVKIRNPNDYVQAAVAKIIREGTSSRNFTGNQTRQKAAEMGLTLQDETLQLLAKMPLRASMRFLEAGREALSRGADPDTAIFVAKQEADFAQSMEDPAAKRPRIE